MINFLCSIRLVSAVTIRQAIVFNRDNATKDEVDVKFTLSAELHDQNKPNPKNVKLRIISSSKALNKEDKTIMDIELITEYNFKIIDHDSFFAQSNEERNKYCSNLAFLDFRGKLSKAFFDIGMKGFTLPMSIEEFSEQNNK